MTDNPGFTDHVRVTTQDTQGAPGTGPAVQPGQMQGSVFADDASIALAEQARAQEEAARPQETRTQRVGDGAQRVTVHSDGRTTSEDLGFRRSNSAPALTGSVLDGARSQSGMPQMASEVTGDSLVNFQGVEVTVAFLEAQGLVARNAAGGYTAFLTGDAAPPAPSPSDDQAKATDDQAPKAEEQAPDDPRNVVEIMLESRGDLKGDIYTAAVDIIGDPDRDPGDLLNSIDEFEGKPHVSEQFKALHDTKATEAREVIARAGVTDPEAFVAWARQQAGWSRSMSQHLLEGNAHAAWDTLGRTFARDHQAASDFEAGDIMGADFGPGVTVSRGPDGSPWISVGDYNGPFKEAVSRGLIKVSAA